MAISYQKELPNLDAELQINRSLIGTNPMAIAVWLWQPLPPDGQIRIKTSETVFPGPRIVLQISAKQNEVDLSPDDALALTKRHLRWSEANNLYHPKNGPLGISSEPGIKITQEWHKFWGIAKKGSLQGKLTFFGDDRIAKMAEEPSSISPADFRLAPGTIGRNVGPGGRDLGPDVTLIGPGEPYDRWRKTPEYQEWLRPKGGDRKTDAKTAKVDGVKQ
jgi:hypothetical protein